jgi:hypothetical protein
MVVPGQAFPLRSTTGRVALWGYPRYVLSYWETATCAEFIRVLSSGARTFLVGATPASVWELTDDLDLLLNLNTTYGATAVYDACYQDGKLYVATNVGMVSFDVDAADESLLIRAPGSGSSVQAVSSAASETVSGTVVPGTMFGIPTAATGGSSSQTVYPVYMVQGGWLHKYVYPRPQKLAENTPSNPAQGGTLLEAGGQVLWGSGPGAGVGAIYRSTPGAGSPTGWTEVYDLSARVRRVWSREVGDANEVWVGAEGAIHRSPSSGGWLRDTTFDSGEVRAFAELGGYMWAGGTMGGLWRKAADTWAQYEELTDVNAVNDLLVADNILYAAVAYTGSKARLYALYIHEGGSFQTGPNPPDLHFSVLQYVKGLSA